MVQSVAISIASPFTMRASNISACTVVAARRRTNPSLTSEQAPNTSFRQHARKYPSPFGVHESLNFSGSEFGCAETCAGHSNNDLESMGLPSYQHLDDQRSEQTVGVTHDTHPLPGREESMHPCATLALS
jgi:hypothetical protein